MDFDDPKEFDNLQLIYDPKGTLIENFDFHSPKIISHNSIFDGLVTFQT